MDTALPAPIAPAAIAASDPDAPCVVEAELRRAVGLADLCELLAATFAFPVGEDLACALADGTYLTDAAGCLADAGPPNDRVQDACRHLGTFVGRDAAVQVLTGGR